MIYDITRTIRPDTAVWPGDVSFSFINALQLAEGDAVNLTTLTLSPHTATHADAYYHYIAGGAHPPAMPLEKYIGPCRVVHVDKTDGPMMPADLHGQADGAERVLIRSAVSDYPDTQFASPYPYPAPELIAYLAEQGCVLLGLDSPSFDAQDSKTLPGHHALHTHNMVNLELLQLRDVPSGDYELVALPLKIDGICGTPVRAILRTLP